jgi:hypothetical protein
MPSSWSHDSDFVALEGTLELWRRGNSYAEVQDDEHGFREHVVRCQSRTDVYSAFLAHAGLLVSCPVFAVRASAEALLGLDESELDFSVASTLVTSMEALGYCNDHSRAKTCWRTMALIAAGKAADVSSLKAHAMRSGDGGNDPPIKDTAGRTLMRGALANNTPGAHRLHWWSGSRPEFVSVGEHDDPVPL